MVSILLIYWYVVICFEAAVNFLSGHLIQTYYIQACPTNTQTFIHTCFATSPPIVRLIFMYSDRTPFSKWSKASMHCSSPLKTISVMTIC